MEGPTRNTIAELLYSTCRRRQQTKQNNRGEQGATLLELLLALTCAALLLAAAHGILSAGLRADRAASARFDRSQIARMISNRFSSDIQSLRFDAKDELSKVSGSGEELTFCTVVPVSRTGEDAFDLQSVTYAFDPETKILTRTSQPYFSLENGIMEDDRLSSTTAEIADDSGSAGKSQSDLVQTEAYDGIDIKFEYLSGTEWTETWDSETEPPSAVRLTFSVEGGLGAGHDHIATAQPAG